MNALYLAADIGGTNSRVAVAERIDGRWQIRARALPEQHYPSAEAMFHGSRHLERPRAAGRGRRVAGPVIEGRTRLTNRGS
ncbi:MAG: glucokinase [Burkholderiales bacterium]